MCIAVICYRQHDSIGVGAYICMDNANSIAVLTIAEIPFITGNAAVWIAGR